MEALIDLQVKNIKGVFHARLFVDGKFRDEMSCDLRVDIGFICREMLRWQAKGGLHSRFAGAARKRQNSQPKGKVKYIGCANYRNK